jgi:hypothetical protein
MLNCSRGSSALLDALLSIDLFIVFYQIGLIPNLE